MYWGALILRILPYHHNITQIMGISLYLHAGQKGFNVNFVKKLYLILRNTLYLWLALYIFSKIPTYRFYKDVFPLEKTITFLLLLSTVLVLLIFKATNSIPFTRDYKKENLIYNLRLLFLMPGLESHRYFAISINHAVEYICLFFARLKKTGASISSKAKLYAASIFLILGTAVIPDSIWLNMNMALIPSIRMHIYITFLGVFYVHHNLDHYFYSSRYFQNRTEKY